MLLRSISAHYEIIGANLIHCGNVSYSQTIPDFLSLRSSWFIYHLEADGEGIPFIFVIREQLWFIYHLGAWGGGGGGIFRGKRGSVVSDRVTGFKGGTILRKWLESFFCQCPAYFDIWRNFIHFEHSAQLLVAQSGSQLQGGRQSEKALDMTKVTRVYFNRRPQCYYDNLWCQKKNFTSTKNCTFLKEKGQTIVDQSKNLYLKKLNQHFIWSHLNPTADAVFHYSNQAMYYFKTLLMRDLHINVGH